jgi:hypothetical protein
MGRRGITPSYAMRALTKFPLTSHVTGTGSKGGGLQVSRSAGQERSQCNRTEKGGESGEYGAGPRYGDGRELNRSSITFRLFCNAKNLTFFPWIWLRRLSRLWSLSSKKDQCLVLWYVCKQFLKRTKCLVDAIFTRMHDNLCQDDQGEHFTVVSEDKMKAVAKFVQGRDRFRISELLAPPELKT